MLFDQVDFNRPIGTRHGARPTRETAVEFPHPALVLNRSLFRSLVSGHTHVDVVGVEDSKVLPIPASLIVLHVGHEIAVDPRVTKP